MSVFRPKGADIHLPIPRLSWPASPVSGEWGDVPRWRRWFLPSDFVRHAALQREETREYRRLLTECLVVKESHRTAIIRPDRAPKYGKGDHPHPEEFRKQRFTIIECAERVRCARCLGRGRKDCSPDTRCPNCRGRRTRIEFCFACGGSGRAGMEQKEQCWACRGSGSRSEDCAVCAGVLTGSAGRVRCKRCGGAGWVVCRRCAGAGVLLRARLTTRRYSRHTRESCLPQQGDYFPTLDSRLSRRLRSMPGELVSREFQTPSGTAVALERVSIFSYRVETRTYCYKDREFRLHRIFGANGPSTVTGMLPWSGPRLAWAGVGSIILLSTLAALLLVV